MTTPTWVQHFRSGPSLNCEGFADAVVGMIELGDGRQPRSLSEELLLGIYDHSSRCRCTCRGPLLSTRASAMAVEASLPGPSRGLSKTAAGKRRLIPEV